jgi:hypothetical protein
LRASGELPAPRKLEGTMPLMFERRFPRRVTTYAASEPVIAQDLYLVGRKRPKGVGNTIDFRDLARCPLVMGGGRTSSESSWRILGPVLPGPRDHGPVPKSHPDADHAGGTAGAAA